MEVCQHNVGVSTQCNVGVLTHNGVVSSQCSWTGAPCYEAGGYKTMTMVRLKPPGTSD